MKKKKLKKKIGMKRRLNYDRIQVYFMSGNYIKTNGTIRSTAIIYECGAVT